MSIARRTFLAGLGAGLSSPAWAQFDNAIRPQNDPWAQVNPYEDARNGFPVQRQAESPMPRRNSLAAAGTPPLSQEDLEEVQGGRLAYAHWIREGGGPHGDPRLQQALRAYCQPIFAVADRANLPWQVTLVNDRSLNASAGPGGCVIVNAGILPFYDDPRDFAAVLAHEVGHVDHRHALRHVDMAGLAELARRSGVTATGDAAMVQLMPELQGRVADFADLARRAYSREDEAQADSHILAIFERLGVDPAHAAGGLAVLSKYAQLRGEVHSPWVDEHPLPADRVRALEKMAALRSKPAPEFTFTGWDVLKAAFPTDPRFKKT